MECPRCGCSLVEPNKWKPEFLDDDPVCLKCGFPVSKWTCHRDIDFYSKKALELLRQRVYDCLRSSKIEETE